VVFPTHYGSQYYCPVSVVRIHGTSHVANLKEKLLSNSKEVGQRINEIKKQTKKESSVPSHSVLHPSITLSHCKLPRLLPFQGSHPPVHHLHAEPLR